MSPSEESPAPGTWRVADGAAVAFNDAKAAWVVEARSTLLRTARIYHGYVTYGDLAESVQESSGFRTRSQMRNWIGGVLGLVADDCHARGEPSLTALCVRQDETVGDGYVYVLELAGEAVPDDLDAHAAAARLECYRFYGATLPANGGEPALTAKVAAARKRAMRLEAAPAAVCSRCFLQLPNSGHCDNCD